MQISERRVFAFVEGKTTDPYFYGRICESVCQQIDISYIICMAQELPTQTGGKKSLITFFEYLR